MDYVALSPMYICDAYTESWATMAMDFPISLPLHALIGVVLRCGMSSLASQLRGILFFIIVFYVFMDSRYPSLRGTDGTFPSAQEHLNNIHEKDSV